MRGTIQTICGLRFCRINVLRSRSRLIERVRLKKAARYMARSGVRRALFPEGFMAPDLFAKQGIAPSDDTALRRRMAAAITRRVMSDRGVNPSECRILLLGDTMEPALTSALMELALHVRYTMISAGGGGGEVCSVLRREYGVCVLREPGAEQASQAQVVLTFSGARPEGAGNCLWLPFGSVTQAEGYVNAAAVIRCSAAPEIEARIAELPCRNAMLSLLLETGALHTNDLEIISVSPDRIDSEAEAAL